MCAAVLHKQPKYVVISNNAAVLSWLCTSRHSNQACRVSEEGQIKISKS